MIYFRTIKIAIVEGTIYKGDGLKTAAGEITISKCTRFKFLEIDFFFTIKAVMVL